jgi:hypothetical protein
VLVPIFNLRSLGKEIKEELGQEFAELTRAASSSNTTKGIIQNNLVAAGKGLILPLLAPMIAKSKQGNEAFRNLPPAGQCRAAFLLWLTPRPPFSSRTCTAKSKYTSTPSTAGNRAEIET